MQLMNSPGWATLLAVLHESSGEPAPSTHQMAHQKRRWEQYDDSSTSPSSSGFDDHASASSSLPSHPHRPGGLSRSDTGDQLAKRFKGASLR